MTRRATADSVSKVVLGGVWEDLGDRWCPHSCWWLKTICGHQGLEAVQVGSLYVGCVVVDRPFPTQCIAFAADVNVEFSPEVEKVQVPEQPECCALVMLGWRTGERKNFLSEAKQ